MMKFISFTKVIFNILCAWLHSQLERNMDAWMSGVAPKKVIADKYWIWKYVSTVVDAVCCCSSCCINLWILLFCICFDAFLLAFVVEVFSLLVFCCILILNVPICCLLVHANIYPIRLRRKKRKLHVTKLMWLWSLDPLGFDKEKIWTQNS